MLTMRTKTKTEQITQELSYSIVAPALADVPLDGVANASMQAVLGITNKIMAGHLLCIVSLSP